MKARVHLRTAALVIATLCVALSFGINYGKSNQALYLLPALHELHPELFARDWIANTRHFHDAYAVLGGLMLRLDPSGWLIGVANPAATAVGLWLAWRMLSGLARPERAFPAFLVVLALCTASRTYAPGDSYVFSDIFQPSTLGSLGLLGAVLGFSRGSAPGAGLALAFAGAFHVNYLLLGLCVFGVAWLVSGAERTIRRAAWLLGPSLVVLAWSVPFLLASSGSALAVESRRIFQEVRAPHHYDVERFIPQFVPWVGFQLLGAWALWHERRGPATVPRRLWSLLIGFWALIVPAAVLSYAGVRSINQLFAWRIGPHASLVAQVVFSAALVERLASEPRRRLFGSPAERLLAVLGLACLGLAAALGASRDAALLTLSVVAVGLAYERWQRPVTSEQSLRLLTAASVVAFLAAIAAPLSKVSSRSNLLGGEDRDLTALCGWLGRSSSRETVVLAPPDEAELRYLCQRPTVVDWKSTPVLPEQVLEWVERMEDVTGRRPLQGPSDVAGYAGLDRERLGALQQKYGVEIVVVRRGASLAKALPPADFSHGRFLAYRLAGTSKQAAGR